MTWNRRTVMVLFVIILVLALGYSFYTIRNFPDAHTAADEASVTSQVLTFGSYLKSVQLAESPVTLKSDVQQSYSQFVTPELLSKWLSDPTSAPGRQTSSPWPDRIEITGISPQGQSYVVTGNIIMQTSAGPAGTKPIILQLVKIQDKWLIAAYQEQAQQTATTSQ